MHEEIKAESTSVTHRVINMTRERTGCRLFRQSEENTPIGSIHVALSEVHQVPRALGTLGPTLGRELRRPYELLASGLDSRLCSLAHGFEDRVWDSLFWQNQRIGRVGNQVRTVITRLV